MTGKIFFISNITALRQNQSFSDRMTSSFRRLFKVFVENLGSDEKNLKAPTSVLYEVRYKILVIYCLVGFYVI